MKVITLVFEDGTGNLDEVVEKIPETHEVVVFHWSKYALVRENTRCVRLPISRDALVEELLKGITHIE
ncbi:MAG: hypothetical protein COV07_03545 [Candidatus Vogelbacteria bacterium CG10_big_fil_rev_8_21_14_0_10_45_14]|uniref:Uncharacterized protein n=1 Tax=Candidatus Vogelbacteria bacterium CG10_big_fil_rev_8_21_14_0_10_45_14 TaxID=1975042 RepID=A0A2H0RJA7_9BACT|nr:MAG: hypothetical protein COV07_03545 [Candidatus Vogelbacteria bacterium CG10_big_fil_rev_8_21_14_0_10_45_14]